MGTVSVLGVLPWELLVCYHGNCSCVTMGTVSVLGVLPWELLVC